MERIKDKEKIISRLKRVEGQLRGIQKMIDEKRSCEDIMMQLSAMTSAVERVNRVIIGCYMEEKIKSELMEHQDTELAVERAMELFIKSRG